LPTRVIHAAPLRANPDKTCDAQLLIEAMNTGMGNKSEGGNISGSITAAVLYA